MTYIKYLDSSLTVAERVDDLLSLMTVKEKIGQMTQLDVREEPAWFLQNHFVGSFANCLDADEIYQLQSMAVHETRLRIPLLISADAIHGHAFWPGTTIFPTQLALASSWNPELIQQVGQVTAVEMAVTGTHQTFSPVLCLATDLRWGRVGETFGEDPYLTGVLADAMVRGYQGLSLKHPNSVLACGKAFLGYGETEGGRDGAEAYHTRRKILSLFAPPFERIVRAGCASIMVAYHAIDGQPCVTNNWLLNTLIKENWQLIGFIQTDWNNADALVELRCVYASYAEAYAGVVNAGVDVLNCTPRFVEIGPELVERGMVSISRVNEACSRVLFTKFALGLFDQTQKCLPLKKKIHQVLACRKHKEAALVAARQSLVLLKNNGILPLDTTTLRRVALVGPNADDITAQLGDWSFGTIQGEWSLGKEHPRDNIFTTLDGMRAILPSQVEILYAPGCSALPENLINRRELEDVQIPKYAFERITTDLESAIENAIKADLVIAVVGDCLPLNGEIRERANLDLTGDQQTLLEAIAGTGRPLIVVLITSKPLTIPWICENAAAILCAWNPGMQGGVAIAEALIGLYNPSGKLPVSWPRHVGQLPVFYNRVPGWQGVDWKGKPSYVDMPADPLFSFGYGLSYTKFQISNLILKRKKFETNDNIYFSLNIKNTGNRDGWETIQVYSRDTVCSLTSPVKELRAFKKIFLEAGQMKTLQFAIPVSQLSFVNKELQRIVEPGEFELMVGTSSRDDDLIKEVIEVR